MILAYAVEKHIIIALDKKAKHLKVRIKDKKDREIRSCDFFDTDFKNIDLDIDKGFVTIELDIDGEVTERKVYVS